MALSKESVKIGRKILEEVNPDGARTFVDFTPVYSNEAIEVAGSQDCIIGWSKKYDDGFGELFTNIKNIEPWQLDKFNELKEQVPNSSFCKEENGVTRLGWF